MNEINMSAIYNNKKFEVTQEFYDAAKELANFINDDQNEFENYVEHVQNTGNRKDHVLYLSSVINGTTKELMENLEDELEINS